jgi:hypothetical protein
MVSAVKVAQIVRIALDWVCSKQNIGQFVSNLIEINFHARICAFGLINLYQEVSKNPPKFVVLEVLILLNEDV